MIIIRSKNMNVILQVAFCHCLTSCYAVCLLVFTAVMVFKAKGNGMPMANFNGCVGKGNLVGEG